MAAEGGFRVNILTVLVVGVAGIALGPIVLPAAARIARPAAKALVKAGIVLYHRGYETAVELGEVAEDILAEANAELAAEGLAGAAQPIRLVEPG